MTDLTGVLTSSGQPLGPSLQHNQVAQHEMQRRWALRQNVHDDAMHAAFTVSTAEQAVESLQNRIAASERRAQSWATASGALPELAGVTDPDDNLAQLHQNLARAEQYLATAKRTHAETAERYMRAHNDAAAFQRKVYADYREPVEVEAS